MTSLVPRWKTAITNALADNEKSVVFQLATIDSTTVIPHVRSHIFRGFLSPTSTPSLPLVLTTTDIRTPKIAQLATNPNVQLAWWIAEAQQQFRIAGRVRVIPSPAHSLHSQFTDNIKNLVAESGFFALEREKFDWEAERLKVFAEMSGYMKATWCRPTPGSPLVGGEEEARRWPVKLEEPTDESDSEARRNWETALGNFALVAIDPTDVDMVELGVFPNRRTRFWRTSDGKWESEAVVP